MSTLYDQERNRTVFVIATESGESYSFHYGYNPEDLMCGLTRHKEGEAPQLIGSSVPLLPLEVGKSALLGVDTQSKDQYILETQIITHIGPA